MRRARRVAWGACCLVCAIVVLACCACSSHEAPIDSGPPTPEPILELRINEVVSNNEGVQVDEQGEVDDYVELFNPTLDALDLGAYLIFDDSGGHALPQRSLAPGATLLLWADDSPEQGELHLPFKISAAGERLRLIRRDAAVVDDVTVPALREHHAYSRMPDGTGPFADCAWATPARTNGSSCGPRHEQTMSPSDDYLPYAWPSPWPAIPTPLRISEARLLPADFVEVENTSGALLSLEGIELRLAATNARLDWPTPSDGVELTFPQASLAAGEVLRVSVTEAELSEIAQTPNFEGVLSAFDRTSGQLVDRLEFSDWPEGASLAREDSASAPFRFCVNASPGIANGACEAVASRAVGKYLHDLQTPGDFAALSSGHATLDEESIGFVVDRGAGDTVVFLNSSSFPTHYNYVRELLLQQGPIDLCTPEGRSAYRRYWASFVDKNFIATEGREYELGVLVKHAGTSLSTITFAEVNAITAEQMKHVFFTLMQHVPDPKNWAVRPMSAEQAERFRAAEGQVPLVATDAPYRGVSFQPLVKGVAYGTLRVAAADELPSLPLGPEDIVLTDTIPNDIPLIAGLITETFQTPLSHVNVLSRGRGTPNMALRDALRDPRVAPFEGQLVRLEVSSFDFEIALADPAEALAFWAERKPSARPLVPRLDLSLRGIVPLSERSLEDIPSIGGKAAQLAELGKVELCEGTSIPGQAFAIPVVYSLEHYERSGASALLAELRGDPAFLADPSVRAAGLDRVRKLLEKQPLDPALHALVRDAIAARWPPGRVRFRSSSNVEDLVGFNGAGLYVSEGVDVDTDADIDAAVLSVWASLWNNRAFSEREYYKVDQSQVAMAVLVHPAFPSERANGVAVSRNVIDPGMVGQMYINAQVGEALVTNPAPGVASDEYVYDLASMRRTVHQHSSFSPDALVMSDRETQQLSCSVQRIHEHFSPLLDPNQENSWFAMDMEFKLMGPERSLLIKQARLYSFGQELPEGWCEL